MTKVTPIGSDTRLYCGPALNPGCWPASFTVGGIAVGLHELTAYVNVADPTPQEMYTRDQAICTHPDWVRVCKVSATPTLGTETADASDDCNTDVTIISKKTTSIDIVYNKRRNVGNIPSGIGRKLKNVYMSEGCLILPIMLLDNEKTNDGADGIWIMASVTDFSWTGALNDPLQFNATLVPSNTPEIDDAGGAGNPASFHGLPMRNRGCVTCFPNVLFATLIAAQPDFYAGEIIDIGGDGCP